MTDNLREQFDAYIGELFTQEDDVLRWVQAEAERHELPAISIDPGDGYLLQWLMRLVGVRKVVEIGVLAGYSGIWIARALPEDGKLYALEKSSKHANVARASFEKAGVRHKIELLEGDAHDNLKKLNGYGPFDMVFIDADKASYPDYLNWAVENLRPGGLVTAHNAYRHGRVLSPQNEDDQIMADFNRLLATHPQLDSIIIPLGDGMAVGVKKH